MQYSAKRAKCRRTAFDEVELSFPFNAKLIDAIKAEIPYRCRSYEPSGKVWRVWDGYQDLAIELLLDAFPDAEIPRRARQQPTPDESQSGSEPFAVLHLLPSAPRELVDAAYRTLAKAAHPDCGGSDAAMRRLTEAHELLSRRLSA